MANAFLDDLISYWKMDEASGNALDAHGSNDFTATNCGSITGKISGGRDLVEASSSKFSKASNSELQTGNIDYTVAMWLRIDAAVTYGYTFLKKNASEYALSADTSRNLTWYVYPGTTASATWGSVLSTGTWYHAIAWHDATANEIGVTINNGTPVTASYTHNGDVGTGNLDIGVASGFAYSDISVDEVGFWKRMLTASERTDLYNSGSGRAYSYFEASSSSAFAYNNFLHAQIAG